MFVINVCPWHWGICKGNFNNTYDSGDRFVFAPGDCKRLIIMAKSDNTVYYVLGAAALFFVFKPKAKTTIPLPAGTVVPPISTSNQIASNPLPGLITTVGDLVKSLITPSTPAAPPVYIPIPVNNDYTQNQIDNLEDDLPSLAISPPTAAQLVYNQKYTTYGNNIMTGYEAEEKYR